MVNNLDSSASEEVRAAAISQIDASIEAAAADDVRASLTIAKANALDRFGDTPAAIEIMKSIIPSIKEARDWPSFIDAHLFLANLYESTGNIESAKRSFRAILVAFDEAVQDRHPVLVDEIGFYQRRLRELEDIQ